MHQSGTREVESFAAGFVLSQFEGCDVLKGNVESLLLSNGFENVCGMARK